MNIKKEFNKIFEELKGRVSLSSPIPFSLFFNGTISDTPDAIISTGVHGNEYKVVNGIIEFLSSLKTSKKILFLFSNPKALEQETRLVYYDLNRIFYSEGEGYEFERSKELESVLTNCNYFLDLHLTQEKTLKKYVISSDHDENISFVKAMDDGIVDFIITKSLNDKGLCFDEAVLKSNPSAVALTFELGSIEDSQEEITQSVIKTASAFISALDDLSPKKELILIEQKQFVKNIPENELIEGLANLQEVSKGDVLTKSGITSEYDGIILFPKYTFTTDSYLLRVAVKKYFSKPLKTPN